MRNNTVVLFLLSGIVTCATALIGSSPAQEGVKRVEVVSKRFAFEPGDLTLTKGQPVVLVLKSSDVAHGLRFRELGVDVKVDKGGTAEVRFTPEKTGDFIGHCSVFCGSGHGSMTLTLHVVN